MLSAIAQKVANPIFGSALDRTYPMQAVATTRALEMLLSEGEATSRARERLTLVQQGEAQTHPYSGQPLGRLAHEQDPSK